MKALIAIVVTAAVLLAIWAVETIVDRVRPRTPLWARMALMFGVSVLVFMLAMKAVAARDSGQWENSDPTIRAWYEGLMQPDAPTASCCGKSDAYWADEVHVRDGKTYATITDDRDDAPLGRPHVPNGTVIEIPNHKLKWDRGNPTGHGVLFLSRERHVYCYVQPGGV